MIGELPALVGLAAGAATSAFTAFSTIVSTWLRRRRSQSSETIVRVDSGDREKTIRITSGRDLEAGELSRIIERALSEPGEDMGKDPEQPAATE
jgi:hypothetical protein